MPSQWKKNKKRKGKPTPSPTNKETVSKKKKKQTDLVVAETQSESEYVDAQEQLEQLEQSEEHRDFHNLADSLPYLPDSQNSNVSDDSPKSKFLSMSQASNMNSVAPVESGVSTIADESFPQSQSVLQGQALAFSSTPVPSGPPCTALDSG